MEASNPFLKITKNYSPDEKPFILEYFSKLLSGCGSLSESQKLAYLEHLEQEEKLRKREVYWEKIFAKAHPPAKKSK